MLEITAPSLKTKEERLHAIVQEFGSVAVAFSAGSDSTYLLAVCRDLLGRERVRAITAFSPTFPQEELDDVHRLTALLDVDVTIVETKELDCPNFIRNDAHRCFYCQESRIQSIWEIAHYYHLDTVLYGITTDDFHDTRPGIDVAKQHDVKMPLVDVGLTKEDIRTLSKHRNLPTYNKPPMACLASRIPYGRHITIEQLEQVAKAERFLRREIGLQQVRVRHHNDIARLEVDYGDITRVAQPEVRDRIVSELRTIGFSYVTLDLGGFHSGSLNEGLKLL
jgi:uncharacterized protein